MSPVLQLDDRTFNLVNIIEGSSCPWVKRDDPNRFGGILHNSTRGSLWGAMSTSSYSIIKDRGYLMPHNYKRSLRTQYDWYGWLYPYRRKLDHEGSQHHGNGYTTYFWFETAWFLIRVRYSNTPVVVWCWAAPAHNSEDTETVGYLLPSVTASDPLTQQLKRGRVHIKEGVFQNVQSPYLIYQRRSFSSTWHI